MEKGEWWQRRRGPEESSVPDKELAQERRLRGRKPHPSQVRVHIFDLLQGADASRSLTLSSGL